MILLTLNLQWDSRQKKTQLKEEKWKIVGCHWNIYSGDGAINSSLWWNGKNLLTLLQKEHLQFNIMYREIKKKQDRR